MRKKIKDEVKAQTIGGFIRYCDFSALKNMFAQMSSQQQELSSVDILTKENAAYNTGSGDVVLTEKNSAYSALDSLTDGYEHTGVSLGRHNGMPVPSSESKKEIAREVSNSVPGLKLNGSGESLDYEIVDFNTTSTRVTPGRVKLRKNITVPNVLCPPEEERLQARPTTPVHQLVSRFESLDEEGRPLSAIFCQKPADESRPRSAMFSPDEYRPQSASFSLSSVHSTLKTMS